NRWAFHHPAGFAFAKNCGSRKDQQHERIKMPLPWIILSPAIGVLLIAFYAYRKPHLASLIACSAIGISFLISAFCVYQLIQLPVDQRVIDVDYFTWIHAGSFTAPFGLRLDPLSAVMILVVTGVGTLIHIYSIGYMHDDP